MNKRNLLIWRYYKDNVLIIYKIELCRLHFSSPRIGDSFSESSENILFFGKTAIYYCIDAVLGQ